ncbi:MAG: phage holin family protein [bacterium]|nr:phage holin family protein [bacterium]
MFNKGFFTRWLSSSLALLVVSYFFKGIEVTDIPSAFIAAFILGIVNAVIRPLIVVFTLPFNIITLGLFTLVINGSMLYLTSWFMGAGLKIDGFWSAVLGALFISIASGFLNYFISDQGKIEFVNFNTGKGAEKQYNKEDAVEADYEIIDEKEKNSGK